MSTRLFFVFLSVSLSSPCLSISPSVCSPVSLSIALPREHTHTHAHTHTSVSLDIFPLFHPTLLYLHALSLSKVTASVFMSYPLCVGVCVCVCVCGSVWHAVTHTNTDAHIHLSMPSGPCAQLSVSLIPFPSSFLNLPSLPHSCSSSSFSLSSHQFLIFSDSRPPYRSSFFYLFIF